MSWGRFSNFNPFQGPTRTVRSCPVAPRNVVVIDEDDDGGEDASEPEVFIIGGAAPPPTPAAAPGCQARKGNGLSGNVITIDDDEDVGEGAGWDKAGPSTSRASSGSPASMTPGRGSPGNRYGFDSTSDSDLSEGWDFDTDDGGSSDCEILDDTSGTAREMWETAASRKKMPHGVHEREDGWAAAFESCARSEAQPYKDSEGFFGAGCNLDETYFSTAWKGDSHNDTGGTKEGSEHVQSSANGVKDGQGPSVPNAKKCSNGNVGEGTEGMQDTNSSAKDVHAEPHPDENIFQSSSDACKGGVQNNTGVSKDHHGPSSAPSAKECSNEEGVVPQKTSEGFQTPRADGTFVYKFVSANMVFPGNSSADRKDGSPPMSVSTPDKIDEKIPDGEYSQKDQSPPEPSHASVIGERERHKESIEYKRAAEEEWASRQRQLQIQAEEAKKLRKRKKAEAQRLLDMEKRQKQRLQEVRESQRKNEEAIQLKEQYRGVVRKELEDLERRYWDMTSILRALGIPVEGGEVKAYKQALLKFHPDRVSRNDMYQQVKAEETFKFISRLKEKLPRF
ncbi:hypothetical protein SEVIR_9G087400v4 [Setaria viridis]|uniref:J domain-containing protein n=1 Tax=Setaria viridis TaxID=4556 RepID=A0A4U6SRR6_SETVI|nr:uncharacterized protein LOC117837304 [Setaria viridis]TKV91309.1 hypothetical protein SEVIR_9G087400v2 [Setaria viridis]